VKLAYGTEYEMRYNVKSNTSNYKDGWAVFRVSGTAVLDIPIQWTENDAKMEIRNIVFKHQPWRQQAFLGLRKCSPYLL
jgi:hypothetical protein